MAKKIKLGDKVKDTITGFEGIAIGVTNWLNGCARWCVSSQKVTDDGKLIELWFDEERLTGVKAKKPGGPRNDPGRRTTG